MNKPIQKNHPITGFDPEAEEAVNVYTSIFKGSSVGTVTRYGNWGRVRKTA